MKAKEARQLIGSAYANIQALRANGYWPLVTPNPSSTEEKLIESIRRAERALADADLYHAMLYGRRPEFEVSSAPCAVIEEQKANPSREEAIKAIEARCREQIEDYEDRVQLALDYMERYHASLSHADFHLDCEILAIIEEWCEEEGGENDGK